MMKSSLVLVWAALSSALGTPFPASGSFTLSDVSLLNYHLRAFEPSTPVHVPEYSLLMPVDHFNASDHRTYRHRYWVNDAFYRSGGPVIFIDYGEQAASPAIAISRGLSDNGKGISKTAHVRLAQELGAMLVGLEHRYYGSSQPVPLSENYVPLIGSKGYEYLTLEQSFQDIIHLATKHLPYANLTNSPLLQDNPELTAKLHPYRTPWIFIGGSYAGTKAAMMRIQNPEIVYAAWASSAPIELRPEGPAYTNSMYRSIPPSCRRDIRAVMDHVNDILSSDNSRAIMDLKIAAMTTFAEEELRSNDRHLVVDHAATLSNQTITMALWQPLKSTFQPFGPAPVRFLCHVMHSYNATDYNRHKSSLTPDSDQYDHATAYLLNHPEPPSLNTTFTPPLDSNTRSGIVAANSHDPTHGLDVGLAAFLYALRHLNYLILSASPPKDTTKPTPPEDVVLNPHSHLPWIWQLRTQLGLNRAVNASSRFSLDPPTPGYNEWLQSDMKAFNSFPGFPENPFPPDGPNLTFPASFGGWGMNPSNVMFTDGEFDPWRAYCISSVEEEDLGAPGRKFTTRVPKCGVPASRERDGEVFGMLHEDEGHCSDLGGREVGGGEDGTTKWEPAEFARAYELFERAVKEWLVCFEPREPPARD